ncbi:hypothetical protein [Jeotgalibaca caeni]|uniref:hypothetical protein n=1 Tax=Jeotgalibaca caeni TaxID=3028623 RepID=UPI00237E8426|nr:hypothetical protein [Jeotgalibaca caeni]MDE1547827.1 hypothetical protein [Jeotgalibaca caeni]
MNQIVDYQLSKHKNNALVRATILQIKDQIIPTKTLLDSDRGFQYISHDFPKLVKEQKFLPAFTGRSLTHWPDRELLGNHQGRGVPPQNLSEFQGAGAGYQVVDDLLLHPTGDSEDGLRHSGSIKKPCMTNVIHGTNDFVYLPVYWDRGLFTI